MPTDSSVRWQYKELPNVPQITMAANASIAKTTMKDEINKADDKMRVTQELKS